MNYNKNEKKWKNNKMHFLMKIKNKIEKKQLIMKSPKVY